MVILNMIASILSSVLVMKHNMDWHRKIILFSVPLFTVFMLFQAEYIVSRIKERDG